MKVKLVNENFSNNYLKNLLAARGVRDLNEYLSPSPNVLLAPTCLDNIEAGRILLEQVIDSGGKILLIIDCDVDGFTSSAIIHNYIKMISPNTYIDYWLHEGKQHGLEDHYNNLMELGPYYDLIICPDSSSNDFIYHEKLREIGSKVLVLDHHDIDGDKIISDNAIVINNQLSENYTNKDLTGAGVTWQFCRYLDQKNNKHYSDDLIDLAALGVCGDMGSVLSMENRYIMKNGFERVKNYFFKKAIEKQAYSMQNMINPTTVAFYIVPLMNAMIRVGSMDEKIRLFQGLIDGHAMVPCGKRGAKGTMEEVAVESLRECGNAKSRQTRITDQMVDSLEIKIHKHDLLENKILFIRLDDDDDFPPEVTGLIAMKLAAKFKHPTLVTRINSEGFDRGSIRNVSDCELTDLKKFLNESGYFEYVQGHPNAAGCSIKDSYLSDFHKYANEALKDIDFNEGAYEVNFERFALSNDLKDLILDLGEHPEIWGQNNSEAKIYISDINLVQNDIQVIGAKSDTLKFEKNGITYIKFKATDMIEELRQHGDIKLNVIGKANINNWMGRKTPQIMIEDYEVKDNSILEF